MRAVATHLCAEVNTTFIVGDDLITNRAAQVFRVCFTVPRILFSLDLIVFNSHTSPSQWFRGLLAVVQRAQRQPPESAGGAQGRAANHPRVDSQTESAAAVRWGALVRRLHLSQAN